MSFNDANEFRNRKLDISRRARRARPVDDSLQLRHLADIDSSDKRTYKNFDWYFEPIGFKHGL